MNTKTFKVGLRNVTATQSFNSSTKRHEIEVSFEYYDNLFTIVYERFWGDWVFNYVCDQAHIVSAAIASREGLDHEKFLHDIIAAIDRGTKRARGPIQRRIDSEMKKARVTIQRQIERENNAV